MTLKERVKACIRPLLAEDPEMSFGSYQEQGTVECSTGTYYTARAEVLQEMVNTDISCEVTPPLATVPERMAKPIMEILEAMRDEDRVLAVLIEPGKVSVKEVNVTSFHIEEDHAEV